MNKLDQDYISLVKDILDNGNIKEDRTGTGTISIFGRQIRHKMSDGFPLLTTKKMPFKTIITELLWFLRGDTNIKYLVDNNCHIWNGDAYKNYENKFNSRPNWGEYSKQDYDTQKIWGKITSIAGIDGGYPWTEKFTQEEFINKIKTDDEFADKWGELGPIYGKQWRSWESSGDYKLPDNISDWVYTESGLPVTEYKPKQIDQIANLINDLKTNPDSRRLMVSAWNVGELDQMVLPPCHYGFQVYTRELSLEERKQIFEDRGYVCDVWPFNGNWHGEYDGFGIPRRAISLMWNQRSVDTGLGLPFNIASYGLLLEIIAKMVNMVPDELIGNLGDTHIYNNHIQPIQVQLDREGYELPKLKISKLIDIDIKKYINNERMNLDLFISRLKIEDFTLENYQSHPKIELPLSN